MTTMPEACQLRDMVTMVWLNYDYGMLTILFTTLLYVHVMKI